MSLKGLEPYYIIIGIIIILLCILLIFLKYQDGRLHEISEYEHPEDSYSGAPEVPEQNVPREKPEQKVSGSRKTPAAIPERPEIEEKPGLVFVIDDVGNSKEQLKKFLKIPFPVTFAIMPDRKYTEESAALIKAAGKDYILHQPMEALGGSDPGKSAIMKGMSDSEIKAVLRHNFAQLPDARGMNNHMGSAATSDPEIMKSVMEYLSDNNLFFLDSFTISTSVGAVSADRHNVKYMKRNSMFLDNENDHEAIQNAINEGKKTAGKNGHAVMIGHVMTGELADLMLDLYPNFIEDGFSLKEISELFIEMNSQEAEE